MICSTKEDKMMSVPKTVHIAIRNFYSQLAFFSRKEDILQKGKERRMLNTKNIFREKVTLQLIMHSLL